MHAAAAEQQIKTENSSTLHDSRLALEAPAAAVVATSATPVAVLTS